ncbi:MAG: S8 family serine peptidase [Acidobacteria bacterium]|nr:S8 family serine peptidase [Acidobacteriota bacterium]
MRLAHRNMLVLGICVLFLAVGVSGPIGVSRAGDTALRFVKPTDSGGSGGGGNLIGDPSTMESVLINVAKPYGPVVEAIQSSGGTVTRQYKNFNGIAARIPRTAIQALSLLTPPGSVTKDLSFPLPKPIDEHALRTTSMVPQPDANSIEFESVEGIAAADFQEFAATHPDAYLVNNVATGVNTLHADGFAGQGMVVAVIDSGIRPGMPHLSLDGSVIGCEDFLGDGNGCSNPANDGHGTFVAGMISANVIFQFNTASLLFRAVNAYLPGAIVAPNRIPMIGSAPLSSIYALRVCNNGCPNSAILAAMDRAIDLRDMYEAGTPGGVNIRVANMSLGGPTLFAGHDLFDSAADALVDHDIVLATSAGNAGPSGLTSGSPAGAFSALPVGAASIAGYERVVRDLQFGFGIGGLYRPTTHVQTASFSSRGPFADGRQAPQVTANGDFDYGQGFGTVNQIFLASGTSFSSPTVAGIAAVLRQAFPTATARQIINAITSTANAGLLGDGSGPQDMGSGFVDAAAARALLATGTVPDALPVPTPPVKSVKNNVTSIAGLPVFNGSVQQSVGPLKPGQRGEIIYEVTPNTGQVIVTLNNFSASLPPAQQNALFGDDVFLTIHTAKTSRQPGTTGYFVRTFTTGGQWVLNNPEFGLIRVTLNGDWTNAGDVSADVSIVSVVDPTPQLTDQGKIHQGDVLSRNVTVPAGASVAEFRALWREGYSHYPANDIDMVLVDPDGAVNTAGATLSDPERAVVNNPKPGVWQVFLFGFEVHSIDDKYELRVSVDGNVIH